MSEVKGLVECSLAEFSDRLAARSPVPGSGCGAAAIGAFGAALASMALRAGRGEDPAEVVELERLRRVLLRAVEADAKAYATFRAAQAGEGDLVLAQRGAIEVPRDIAAAALAALERLHGAYGKIRGRLHAETLTASQALLASVEGATFSALANRPPEGTRAELDALRQRARGLATDLRHLLDASVSSP